MSFPVDGRGDAAELRAFDAVKLFEARAALARPSFALDPRNAGSVAKICRGLDGIPLAIELAAARAGSLAPETIADRLEDRFRILTGGSSTGPERHQTLEAAFTWSYELLEAREQLLFARLSVFGGGFTTEMAEEVCAGDGIDRADVVPLAAALVEKSLVSAQEANAGPRYRLLETLREYAGVRLEEVGDPEAVRSRHRDWCVRFADDLLGRVHGPGRVELFDRLASESDNLEAALEWAEASGSSDHDVEALARALAWHWLEDGYVGLSIKLLETALARRTTVESEAEIRALLGWARFERGDVDAAFLEAERAYRLVVGLEPSHVKVWVLTTYASFYRTLVDKDPRRSIPVNQEALVAADALGDPFARIRALLGFGNALVWSGELDHGLEQHRAAIDLASSSGDPTTMIETYETYLTVVYLHPVARRSEPARVAEEMLARVPFEARGREDAVGWLPWVFLQSGQWDRAEQVLDRIGSEYLEGWERAGYLVAHGSLRRMQGRLEEAESDLAELQQVRVNPRLYHDYYPLVADVAADAGRLADVRATADRYLAVEVDPTEEAKKVGVLSPLARAEADAALAASGSERVEHIDRARAAVGAARDLLERFPPPTEGSVQMETPATYLAFAEAELSRAAGPDPAPWQEAVDRADYVYFRLYSRWRLAEALVGVGRLDEAEIELRAARADAVQVGADGLRRRFEALAGSAGMELSDGAPSPAGRA